MALRPPEQSPRRTGGDRSAYRRRPVDVPMQFRRTLSYRPPTDRRLKATLPPHRRHTAKPAHTSEGHRASTAGPLATNPGPPTELRVAPRSLP